MRHIDINQLHFESEALPSSFDGYKILHITDLHNRRFGISQSGLIKIAEDINPNAIYITGDLIDNYKSSNRVAIDFVRHAVGVSTVYYVPGNHEYHQKIRIVIAATNWNGVIVLNDQMVSIGEGDQIISVVGVKDPDFSTDEEFERIVRSHGKKTDNSFWILLSHKQRMNIFKETDFDLVFCGHAHGGLMRLPFGKALYAPEQGFFPKYTNGLYTENDTTLVMSQGLGNTSNFPIRIFNPPECVVVTLHSKETTPNE